MIARADLVAAAKGLEGVPYGHHGRDPAVALDCAGVVVAALEACGMPLPVRWTYPAQPTIECAEMWVEMFARPVTDAGPGDVVVEDYRGFGHVSLVVDDGRCITAWPGRAVCERAVRRPHSFWRIRGVA